MITAASIIPGLIFGAGIAILIWLYAPRTVRADYALARLGEVATITPTASPTTTNKWHRAGGWVAHRAPQIRYFTAPTRDLDLLDIPVPVFYAAKLRYALTGLLLPLILPLLLQLVTGQLQTLPVLLSPIVAAICWTLPDGMVAKQAAAARREFTRFVAVYLELVSVALLGRTTAEAALIDAATVSDSWVFRRIRSELALADLTRTTKWDALEQLGETVGVDEMVGMARTMRQADAQIGLRDQLESRLSLLRAQIATNEKEDARRNAAKAEIPVYLTLIPPLLLLIVPAFAQLGSL